VDYGDGFALLDPAREPEGLDLVFAVTAHEVAHQWWGGGRLQPARVEGVGFLIESMATYSATQALIPDGTDVLITHGPPVGIGDRSDDAVRAGCADLLVAVSRVKPLLHLFGHIHPDGGCWPEADTCFANVTTWEGLRKASVFDLDVTTRRVTPVSVPPAE
jgi:hypothetical protein